MATRENKQGGQASLAHLVLEKALISRRDMGGGERGYVKTTHKDAVSF